MILPLPTLPGWSDLPFWTTTFPAVQAALADDTRTIFPPQDTVFRALSLLQPNDINVVILGQDPYHTPAKADGLAFSIPDGFGGRLDSLGNIFKEIQSDLGQTRTKTSLEDWAAQGVLLLNTALTVPQGAAKAHAKIGWSTLTRDVIARLADRPRAFALWGAPAQGFAPDHPDHLVITSPHPSPLSVHRGFFGSRPFSRINTWLAEQGKNQIHWADP